LNHAEPVLDVSFGADDHRLTTAGAGGTLHSWDLSPHPRPADSLLRLARLLNGQRLDRTGTPVPLSAGEVREAWQSLRARYPADFCVPPAQAAAWHLREAEAALRDHDWTAALFHADHAVHLNPQDPGAWAARASAQHHLFQGPDALCSLLAANLLMTPAQRRTYYWRRLIDDASAGTLPTDLTCIGNLLALDPGDAKLWKLRADVRARQGDWAAAVADFDQAVGLGPDLADWWYDAAQAHVAAHDPDGYRRTCAALVERFDKPKPGLEEATILLTCTLASRALPNLAPLVRRARQLGPTRLQNPTTLQNLILGALLYRAGDYSEAVATLEKAAGNPEPRGAAAVGLFLAMAQWRLGYADQARKWFDRSARLIDSPDQAPSAEGGPGFDVDQITVQLLRSEAERELRGPRAHARPGRAG
jgi:tetratricopeptide (TPR) repeat protein